MCLLLPYSEYQCEHLTNTSDIYFWNLQTSAVSCQLQNIQQLRAVPMLQFWEQKSQPSTTVYIALNILE